MVRQVETGRCDGWYAHRDDANGAASYFDSEYPNLTHRVLEAWRDVDWFPLSESGASALRAA